MNTRDKYRKEAHLAINKAFEELRSMEEKLDQVTGKAKSQLESKIGEMKDVKLKLQENFHDLVSTTDENWDQSRQVFSNSLEHFKKGLHGFKQMLKK